MFHKKGYTNPEMIYKSSTIESNNARMDAFHITPTILRKLDSFEPINSQIALNQIQGDFVQNGMWLFKGNNVDAPEIGDIRIRFEKMGATPAGVLGLQYKNAIVSFTSKNGNKHLMAEVGLQTVDSLINKAKNDNIWLTWILRIVGYAMMYVGIILVLQPIRILADIVPFIGYIFGFGLSVVAGVIATPLTSLTIAIAWFSYRPIHAIILLILCGIFVYYLPTIRHFIKSKIPQKSQQDEDKQQNKQATI